MENGTTSNASDEYDPFSLTNPVEDRLFGAIMTLFTVFFTGPYLACLWVLATDQEMSKNPCYRVIFHIGVADVIQGVTNGIGGGLFSLLRSAPHQVNKRVGSVLEGCWMAYSVLVNLLAFNRFIQVCFSGKASQIFSKRNTTLLIAACWMYGLMAFVVYHTPWVSVVYYPEMYLWGYDGNDESVICGYVEEAMDLFQLLCVIIWYIGIFVGLKMQTRHVDASTSRGQISKKELRVVIQSLVICCLYFATCFGFFVVPQIAGNNQYVTFVCDMIWLTNCGCNPFIYMAFNTKLRRKVLGLVGKKSAIHANGSRTAVSLIEIRRASRSVSPGVMPVGEQGPSKVYTGTAVTATHY